MEGDQQRQQRLCMHQLAQAQQPPSARLPGLLPAAETTTPSGGQPGLDATWGPDTCAEAAVCVAQQRTSYTAGEPAAEPHRPAPTLMRQREQQQQGGQLYGTQSVRRAGNNWTTFLPLLRVAALAAAAHDHALVWRALHQARCCTSTPLQRLIAAVNVVPAGQFNFPPAEYTNDQNLLVLLASSGRQQLEEHLEPGKLAQWYAEAQ